MTTTPIKPAPKTVTSPEQLKALGFSDEIVEVPRRLVASVGVGRKQAKRM